jgi:threonylcarbamoyladenosine tRNA methylthiotransferase MtaB
MLRIYTTAQFAELTHRILDLMPDVCLGTDVITSTPAEDRASFAKTLQFVKNLQVSYIHAFTYSPRPGTPMAEEHNPNTNPRQRTNQLRKLSEEKNLEYRRRFLNQVRQAVVLSQNRVLTDNYIHAEVGQKLPIQAKGLDLGVSTRQASLKHPRSIVGLKLVKTTPKATYAEVVNED